ncbi:hypothetical protein [Ornithinibacillus contaminans]|uniref:hypothetical protein n=1 Tax=Ornithinibacillus contaminans TaxID=694055 RepID=UPI00064D994A|nr:hypothetical protein [Ornithinibacillus contaminans]
MKPEINHKINSIDDTEIYWKKMYDELEAQMYNMMEMTVELIDSEVNKWPSKNAEPNFNNFNVPHNSRKEFRRLQLFEHRIKVTWLGKLTLAYIALKRRIRAIVKGK